MVVDMTTKIEYNTSLNEFNEDMPQKPWISLKGHSRSYIYDFGTNRCLVYNYIGS